MKKYISMFLIVVMLTGFMIPAQADTTTEKILDSVGTILENKIENIQASITIASEIIKAVVEKFNDLTSKDGKLHWAIEYIAQLTDYNIINGFPDGTFKPEEKVTVSQFLKMVLMQMTFDIQNAPSGYWARPYINKAMDIGLVKSGEFPVDVVNYYEKPITRGEMSRIVARAVGIDEGYEDNLEDYRMLIKDYAEISPVYQPYVLKAFSKGIITGYPDGTFRDYATMTRAEASAVIMRMLDFDLRKVPERPVAVVNPRRPYKYADTDPVLLGIEEGVPGSYRVAEGETIHIPYYNKPITKEDISGTNKYNNIAGIGLWAYSDGTKSYIAGVFAGEMKNNPENKKIVVKAYSYIYPKSSEQAVQAMIDMSGKTMYSQTVKYFDGIKTTITALDDGGVLVVSSNVNKVK